jgi:integrase
MPGRRQHAEGSLYQRTSDGRWIAVVHMGWKGGKRQRRVFTGTTPEAAVKRREAFLAVRRDGFTVPKGRPMYVSEWMIHWLDVIAKREVKPTTWASTYQQKVRQLIVPYFERVPLPDLSEEDIEYWHAQLEERISPRTGRPVSAATIGQCHRIMSRALKVAVARKKIARNPCSNVRPPRASAPEILPPTPEETGQIFDACARWPNGARWILAITTGLRQGEALALTWRDVKLTDPPSVTVRQSAARLGGKRVTQEPKSAESRRVVPLPEIAVAALREHRKSQIASLDGVLFMGARGKPVHPRVDYEDWQRMLACHGIPPYRVHDCRHGYATMLLEQGVPDRVVQAMLGHSTMVLLKRYQHVRESMHRQAADAIDRVAAWKPGR